MAPNTGFMERSDSFRAFLLLPRNMWKLMRVKFNYGRSRLPVLFWCTISLKKYRHITLAKDYTDYISKGRYAVNMQKGISKFVLFGTKELNFVLVICVFQFAVQIFIHYLGRAYTFVGLYSIQFCFCNVNQTS